MSEVNGGETTEVENLLPATRDGRRSLYESMTLERTGGGARLLPQNFSELLALAKLMAMSSVAVPPHLRDNAGACFAVAMQACRWDMDPFAVASKSYLVESAKNPEPKIAYEAAVLAAVVHTRANLAKRPEAEYNGEGPERTCKVTFTFTNGDVRSYTSPQFKDIKTKNSPLWFADPDQQFYYYSIRACARKWTPEVLLGVYDRDEIEGAEPLRDITPRNGQREKPDLAAKLSGGVGEGYSASHIQRETQPDRQHRIDHPDRQHLIDHQPGDVVNVDAAIMTKEVEPVRTGNTVPGEVAGTVRADAKGKKRGGKKDDQPTKDNGPDGKAAVGSAAQIVDALMAEEKMVEGNTKVEVQYDSEVSGASSSQDKVGLTDTELLTKLSDTIKPFTAEKAIRNRWHIEFEGMFAGRPEKVRKAAGTILYANIARVKESDAGGAKLTAEECTEHCERAIARVATEGDLFGGDK